MMKIYECPICQGKIKIKKYECRGCGVSFEGEFFTSPVMALDQDQQTFIELFILSSGSLKEMAQIMGVTYPTVRARLDQIIADLKKELKSRDGFKENILEQVNQGKITPKKAAQIIKNL